MMFWRFLKKKKQEDNKIQELEKTIQELTAEIQELKSLVVNEEKNKTSLKKETTKSTVKKETTKCTAEKEAHNEIRSMVTAAEENKEILLPDSLASKVPAESLIAVTSYADKEKSHGNRWSITPDGVKLDDTYIQYEVKRDANLVFAKSFHPFLQKYTNNLDTCSQNILKSLQYRPFRFEITQDALCVALDGGYYTCRYKETSNGIMYAEWYQDSYHDGGGSGSTQWVLSASSVEKAAENLLHDRYLGWCIIPECKGYWYEKEHLYLVDPWDIPGIFEYSCCVATRSEYDSDIEIKKIGVKIK